MSIANLTLAVAKSRKRDGEPDAFFIRCTAFGKTAEAVGRYTAKGSRIMTEGELQIETYTDKQGQSRTSTSVAVSRVEFLDSRQDSQRQQAQPQTPPQTPPQAEFQPTPQAQDPWSVSSYAPSYQQQKLQPGDFAPIEPEVSDDPDLPF